MAEPEQAPKQENEIVEVVDEKGRIAGCRGRVLVALIILAVLLLLLLAMLFRGLMTRTAPQPPQASAGSWSSTSDAPLRPRAAVRT